MKRRPAVTKKREQILAILLAFKEQWITPRGFARQFLQFFTPNNQPAGWFRNAHSSGFLDERLAQTGDLGYVKSNRGGHPEHSYRIRENTCKRRIARRVVKKGLLNLFPQADPHPMSLHEFIHTNANLPYLTVDPTDFRREAEKITVADPLLAFPEGECQVESIRLNGRTFSLAECASIARFYTALQDRA